MKVSEAITELSTLVQDKSKVLADAKDTSSVQLAPRLALKRGLIKYSLWFPRVASEIKVCDGNAMILTSSLQNYDPRFASGIKIQFPIIDMGFVHFLTNPEDFTIDQETIGEAIRFNAGNYLIGALPANQQVRIVYEYGHVLPVADEGVFTVDDNGMEAVITWASGEILRSLANYYGQATSKPQITETLMGFTTKSTEYLKLANAQFTDFDNIIKLLITVIVGPQVKLVRS